MLLLDYTHATFSAHFESRVGLAIVLAAKATGFGECRTRQTRRLRNPRAHFSWRVPVFIGDMIASAFVLDSAARPIFDGTIVFLILSAKRFNSWNRCSLQYFKAYEDD